MAHKLGIIGGGNMGGAIVRGCIAAKVLAAKEFIIAEIDADKRRQFHQLGCATTEHPVEAADAEQILLAVKPQVFPSVAGDIKSHVKSKVVMSIMAGLNSKAIRASLGDLARVIRVMPNVPCQIGAGMTAIALGNGAQAGDEKLALSIFSALGQTTMIDESLMYAVTAVSASGPAYIFAMAEAMEQAAVKLGFDQTTAKLLVAQTVMGAGKLLAESTQSAAELRQSVTSPAGTTAAALNVMQRREFNSIIIEALTAARDRGAELDKSL